MDRSSSAYLSIVLDLCAFLKQSLECFRRAVHRRALSKEKTCVDFCFSLRFQEKGNLEVLLFTIQSKLRANNQKPYVPHDGKLISDINKVLYILQRCWFSNNPVFQL